MRLFVQHKSHYAYPAPAALGPHTIRLRPASHAKAKIEHYSLRVSEQGQIRWQQDPYGNHIARVTFQDGTKLASFDVTVELAVDIRPVNPFDFFVDDRAENVPFTYPAELLDDLVPFFGASERWMRGGPRLERFLAELPRAGHTVSLIVEINRRVRESIQYVVREQAGIWTPEETLEAGRGSCRDSAVLLTAALRSRGLATRFVSGYLIQLTDEGMIPDQPRGVDRDVVDLHAWAEVYLPGAGWIGLDATSGLLCGEGHIPLACTANPALAAPIDGTSDAEAVDVSFELSVGRLGHEPRPTAPYTENEWQELMRRADAVDGRLAAQSISLWMGGEPTFNSRDHAELPEWNAEALGPTKWSQGMELARALRAALLPGAAILERAGKWYPGESLPRWAIELCAQRNGAVVWRDFHPERQQGLTVKDARRAAERLAQRLGLKEFLQPAYEDPWRFLQTEAALPIDADPLRAALDDPEDRRRLARVLDHGLGREVGFVLPLARRTGAWRSDRWIFRRGHLFLVPGDSPIGLRLPLGSLAPGDPAPKLLEEEVGPPDPRRQPPADGASRAPDDDENAGGLIEARPRANAAAAPTPSPPRVRTALCVEPRNGVVYVFLPPLETGDDFFALVSEIDAVRHETGLEILLEGYPPPPSPVVERFSITPDPGVLEVNVPPTSSMRAYAELVETVFACALRAGLHSEKYLLDGRQAGSGGGNHLTLGGATPLSSPFLKRPDVLASLLTFLQHHPSLSYMFTGLFVGPTSQAPRIDEARHESVYELEIALTRAFESVDDKPEPAPWLSDMLFRHILVDLVGNSHRAEVCIDKLYNPTSPHGRHGIVELRAFEMPPHHRMMVAQMLLVRALVASFVEAPYQAPLVRWGQRLHDQFLLPYWMWRDFEDVLDYLERRGLPLSAAGYRPFVDLRCPLVGTLHAGDITVEVRNAIEPWHVLGEETTSMGTSRYVDSSLERIEVRAVGLVPERHKVLVNGHVLPMRATGETGLFVGGVRFRAWAPPHSLHAHIGIHHPIHIDLLDSWGLRSLGACAYHVWHPEGRAFDSPPLTRFEAAARRAQRFTTARSLSWPVKAQPTAVHGDTTYTLDLRRYRMDHRPPGATDTKALTPP